MDIGGCPVCPRGIRKENWTQRRGGAEDEKKNTGREETGEGHVFLFLRFPGHQSLLFLPFSAPPRLCVKFAFPDTPVLEHKEQPTENRVVHADVNHKGGRFTFPPAGGILIGRMHVCHVITRMIVGGAQENTLLTCEGLAARGHKITLISGPAVGPEGSLEDRARNGGYRYISLPAMRRNIHPAWDWLALRRLTKLLRELAPDVVHTHSSKAGVLGRRAAVRAAVPRVVHTIHGLPFHPANSPVANRFFVAIERRLARRTDVLISVADDMTRQALAAGVGRPDQFVTIPSGMEVDLYPAPREVALQWRHNHNFAPDDFVIACVARLAPLKGYERVLAMAERLCGEFDKLHFVFAGDGVLRAKLEQQIRHADLTNRVHLLGLIPPAEIPAMLTASDLLVHASDHEGLPRAVVQSRLCGVPVVAYDVDGTREVLTNNLNGLLIPPPPEAVPADQLTAATQRLLADPALRHRLAAADETELRERFAAEAMVDEIEAVYRTHERLPCRRRRNHNRRRPSMTRNFYIATHDNLPDPMPRSCVIVEQVQIRRGNLACFLVKASPSFSTSFQGGSIQEFEQVILAFFGGQTPEDVGTRDIVVDIVICPQYSGGVIDERTCSRMGTGTLHATYEEALEASPLAEL